MKISKDQATKTLLGTILIKTGTGIVSCWGTINLYFLSYFYEQGESINQQTNSILLLAIIIPVSVFILFAPKLANMIGHEKIIRICSYIYFVSPLLLHWKFSIFTMLIFCMVIPTTAFAISTVPLFYCIWTQFPQSKNKATSAAIVFFGLGAVLWNYIFAMIVNPNNEKANIYVEQLKMSFFDESVTKNVKFALLLCYFIAGVLFMIGSQFIKENVNFKKGNETTEIQLNQYSPPESFEGPQKIQTIKESTLKQTLMNPKFICLFLISFFSGVFQIYINTNVKILYMPIVEDDHFLAYSVMVCMVISTFGAFVWGYIGDKYGFLTSLIFFAFFDCLVKLYGCFADTKPSIMTMFFLLGLTDKGMLTLMGPGFVQLFGIKMATELLPYKGISIFLGFAFAPLMYLLLSPYLSSTSYLIFLWVFSVLAIILAWKLYRKTI